MPSASIILVRPRHRKKASHGRDFGTEHRSKGPSARLTTENPVCHYARDGRRERSRLDLLRCHEKNLHESKLGRPFLMAVAFRRSIARSAAGQITPETRPLRKSLVACAPGSSSTWSQRAAYHCLSAVV